MLIVTYFFPPLNAIASLRPYAWAKYWSRAGHEVTVLTARKVPRDGLLDLEIDSSVTSAVKVIEIPPFPLPGPRSSATRGMGIDDEGASSTRHQVKTFVKRVLRGAGIDPSSRHWWALGALQATRSLSREQNFDVVVSSYGPPASHIIAGLIKRRLPVFWVADYRDLWFGSSLLTGKWPFSRVEKKIEDTLVRKADLITTVSDPWRDMLRARFGEGVITIENGFDLEDLQGLSKESLFPRDGKIRVVYTGTFYPERQNPEPLFCALARLRDQGVPIDQRLEVLFYGVKRSALESLVTRYRLQGIVTARTYTDRKTVLRAQRDADLLLFLDWIDPSFRGMLTGKLYEYLYAGTPVLCIGQSSDTDAARFIDEARIGLSVGMSESLISTTLSELLLGKPLPYSPSPEALARFTRERLSRMMLDEIVNRLAQRSSQSSEMPRPS